MSKHEIKIVTWNVNSIEQKLIISKLQIFLEIHKIDIELINEIILLNNLILELGDTKYITIYPQNTIRDGSAVIIKESIVYYEETQYQTDMQATTISIKDRNFSLVVSAAYSSRRHNLKKKHYLDFLRSLEEKFIAEEDLNAKNTYWRARLTTIKGRELLSVMQEHECNNYSTDKPIY